MSEIRKILRRAVIQIEVLYDQNTETVIDYAITNGFASGRVTVISDKEVTRETMRQLLIAQGSDPAFLLGEDEDED